MGEISRYRRLTCWDYASGASMFISISTMPRRCCFGRVVDGVMRLSPLGETVAVALEEIPIRNPGLSLFGHVVMPDHIHFNVHLAAGQKEPLKVLGNAIRRFKNYTTKAAKMAGLDGVAGLAELSSAIKTTTAIRDAAADSTATNVAASRDGQAMPASADMPDGQTAFGQFHLWQQGYHDYLLVSRRMIDSTERYIAYNPLKWTLMHGTPESLRIVEPLDLPRIGAQGYWKGVGNLSLLDEGRPMVSLRVSRKVSSASAVRAVVNRMAAAVDKGYVVISGFISQGECAVRDMLCRRRDACFVRMRPSCIPNRRFRPESAYVSPFAEGRYLEIAEGNDETEFGRRACLNLNDAIIDIATSGNGIAVYWKSDGPSMIRRTQNCKAS